MFRPLSLYIGLRYTRAKKRTHFVSFISLMSMLGIALGVMVLITVLSVMNGFDQQIREKLFVLVPHITLTSNADKITDWQSLVNKLKQNPAITAVTPIASGQALLTHDNDSAPVLINGILPSKQGQVLDLEHKVIMGSLADLNHQSFGMILGARIAASLGVTVGDSVTAIIPVLTSSPIGPLPRFKQFKVVGIFEAGAGFGFDSTYAFINLPDSQRLFMLGQGITTLQINVKNLFAAPQIAWDIQRTLGDQYNVTDWTQEFGSFYHAVEMEKTMMFFILLLIIAIAAFNLVSSLMMGVNDKQADIAILRTLGTTPATIMRIFIIQGGIIGGIGTLLGVLLGILLSLNITGLVNFIQRTFHIQFLNPDIYFVDYLPSQLQFNDIWQVALIAFVMSLVATIYPAWRASKVQPAEALRYE